MHGSDRFHFVQPAPLARHLALTNCVNIKGHLCTLVTVCARIASNPREQGAILHICDVETGWHIPCIYERVFDRSPFPST